MSEFLNVTLGGLLGSSLASAVFGALALRRSKRVEGEIKEHFDRGLKVFESTRAWKEQVLFELLGPMQMQFERTQRAFRRWGRKNLYLEAEVVRKGNETIRDLLLTKGHLIPPGLMGEAGALVEHYDAWLERFEEVRGAAAGAASSGEDFVYVGPAGYPFPSAAEAKFKEEFRRLQKELYGV